MYVRHDHWYPQNKKSTMFGPLENFSLCSKFSKIAIIANAWDVIHTYMEVCGWFIRQSVCLLSIWASLMWIKC